MRARSLLLGLALAPTALACGHSVPREGIGAVMVGSFLCVLAGLQALRGARLRARTRGTSVLRTFEGATFVLTFLGMLANVPVRGAGVGPVLGAAGASAVVATFWVGVLTMVAGFACFTCRSLASATGLAGGPAPFFGYRKVKTEDPAPTP